MLRYIALPGWDYEGLDTGPMPVPSFPVVEEAVEYGRTLLNATRGNANYYEIIEITVPVPSYD